MHVFTESQKSLLTCVPKGAALLSLVSASYAGVKILRSQRRLRRIHHRIFLGLTASCMVSNITFIVGTWAMPAEAQGLFVMNIGNEWTCAAQAFFSELGVAGSYSYLSALSISSCLAIRHDFQEIRYRKYEKYIHFTCILLPLILSILLLASGNYGTDVSRCWIPHHSTICVDEDCSSGSLEKTDTLKRILYEIGLPMIMHFVCVVFTALAIRSELKKRKTHKESQGKVLFMETARKKKSKQQIFFAVAHLGASILLSVLYFSSRNVFSSTTREHQSFAYLLAGVVAYNLLGFFHVIIYLSIKKTQIEDSFSSLLERHSLRKSIRSVRNVPLVSGGYKPKTSAISTGYLSASANTTDFGIYMGGAEDMEDEVNEEESNSKSLSFSFTQKADTCNEKTSLSISEE